jgi:hypothetical protein
MVILPIAGRYGIRCNKQITSNFMIKKKNNENLFKQMFVTQTRGFIDIFQKRPFWIELANDLNGVFKVKHTIARDLELLFLQVPYQDNIIEFTESDAHPLSINCIINAKQQFNFSISFEDIIEKLYKYFGQQDIVIDDEVFDKKYLIQADNIEIIKGILIVDNLKGILLRNNVFCFNCNYQKKDATITLMSLVSRTINSKKELLELYKMFSLTIDKLKELRIV